MIGWYFGNYQISHVTSNITIFHELSRESFHFWKLYSTSYMKKLFATYEIYESADPSLKIYENINDFWTINELT
jgi:hypothetical protein